ncbi:hypothetical protein COT75_00575 [Candidatus Beckwithbacteria bacterium CG10_big_fil_rev_8_21_14_0_10_34_10]|uniref:Type 4 fimbrial biogenesis protein PilX N-terminal domain-containing protein n=1 Tax=Candidatus Beckwithbacteria bacterium CG10_big_fil_rev_8_21_14_0_10_34_10 TaxID=1974495 RepID=A0A2H0WAL5_9BACT|nr:MAG: hypothetical protein COT75_00575 [Candidatus Beckwithbacteria bacterium CG10_big_fil_rev_8_21_14_0_10_34_10]
MKNGKSGQIALIVLLIMVVVLTIGLYLISHSVTDVSVSKDEEEAKRAFSAAEAGIEEALRQSDLGTWIPADSLPDLEGVTVEVVGLNEITNKMIDQNEFININLSGLSGIGTLDISWSTNAALELILYIDNAGAISTQRWAIRSPSVATCAENFTDVPSNSYSIGVAPNNILLRIRALCSPTDVTIIGSGGIDLAVQQYEIESRATIGQEKGKSSAIQVTKSIEALPPVFDYVLFSKGGIE